MARSFNGTTTQIAKSSGVVTALPFSFGCWVNPNASPSSGVMGIGSATGGQHMLYDIEIPAGKAVAEALDNTAGVDDETALSTLTLVAGTWYHVCAVFASTTSRTIYANGGNSGTSSVSVTHTAAALTYTSFGGVQSSGTLFYGNNQVAFAGFWNVALSASDVAALAAGAHPTLVRPSALVASADLLGSGSPEPDLVSSTGWTLVGAPTVTANPRIYLP